MISQTLNQRKSKKSVVTQGPRGLLYNSSFGARITIGIRLYIDLIYLERIERGDVNPTLEKIYELANSLTISSSMLLPIM